MKKKLFIFLPLLLFIFIGKVNAGNGTFSVSNTTLEVGQSKTLTIKVSSGVRAADGDVYSSDDTCVQVTSKKYVQNMTTTEDDITSVGNVTIKGLKGCTTTLVIRNATISTDHEEEYSEMTLGTITVKEKEVTPDPAPSDNTTTNNTDTKTDDNKTSDNKSNNSSSTTTSKNYNNTKKDGSKDNTLAKLSVDGYDINFNKNTTSYSIDVKYDVESIKVDAKANDSKAKVDISGESNLKYGANNVKIVVTAENGDKKTYTIVVNREADPNKELKDVNDLESIKPSVGILSPVFDKDKTNYVIYLPYEVNEIKFDVTAVDSASIEKEEVDTLKIGDNVFKYNVRAENGNIKTYTIVVRRFGEYEKSNTKLKTIDINGGSLLNSNGFKVKDFDGNIKNYLYTKGSDFTIDAIAEDNNNEVKVIDNGDVITIIVSAPNGDYSVYTLNKYNFFSSVWFFLILFILGFGIGYGLARLVRKRIKNKMVKSL